MYLKIHCRFLNFTSAPHYHVIQVYIYGLGRFNQNDRKNELYSSVNCYLTPRLTFLVKVVFLNAREKKD